MLINYSTSTIKLCYSFSKYALMNDLKNFIKLLFKLSRYRKIYRKEQLVSDNLKPQNDTRYNSEEFLIMIKPIAIYNEIKRIKQKLNKLCTS